MDEASVIDVAEDNSAVVRQFTRGAEEAVRVAQASSREANRDYVQAQLKLLDMMQANVAAAFDHARKVVAAKSLPETMELNSAYIKSQMVAAAAQAETMRNLWLGAMAGVLEPYKQSLKRYSQQARMC
ncbi:MAG: phasin family protein [Hyphomicrobiales bacterium]|nr:phasin family protein [Hyphomicrobiales bacterium]